jgi:hypothetical protein
MRRESDFPKCLESARVRNAAKTCAKTVSGITNQALYHSRKILGGHIAPPSATVERAIPGQVAPVSAHVSTLSIS